MTARACVALLVLWLVGAFAVPAAAGPPAVRELVGTLRLSPGRCAANTPGGSYLAVTFGTRAITNHRSSCDGGAVTLLAPGGAGLSTQSFSPTADARFDGHGDPAAGTIAKPVAFNDHEVGLVTSARNLQDGPSAAPAFELPTLYLIGSKVVADVRSVQALYGGLANSSCASASGYGCWLIGAERATGRYDAATHRISLSWFSGQSFTAASAGTEIHLVGTFAGAPHAVAKGATVELGTASFAAGSSNGVASDAADRSSRGSHNAAHGRGRRHRAHRVASLAAAHATTAGSPRTFLIAEVIVELNLVVFGVVAFRRRRR
jgi:hypothetical protein